MTISLVVLLVPIAVFVALYRLRGGEDVVVVDPTPAIVQAQAAAVFPVAAPTGLTDAWRPVSAVFKREAGGASLRLGYITPDGGAVQLIESNDAVEGLLIRELGDRTRPTGTVTVAGHGWNSYEVRGDERALVWTRPDRTLIVIGRAPAAELETLAAAVS
jgi:hypothetical protein